MSIIDDTNSALTYTGTWTYTPGSSGQEGSAVRSTTQVGASVRLRFRGALYDVKAFQNSLFQVLGSNCSSQSKQTVIALAAISILTGRSRMPIAIRIILTIIATCGSTRTPLPMASIQSPLRIEGQKAGILFSLTISKSTVHPLAPPQPPRLPQGPLLHRLLRLVLPHQAASSLKLKYRPKFQRKLGWRLSYCRPLSLQSSTTIRRA